MTQIPHTMLQKSFPVRWKLTCLPCVTHHAKTCMYVISFQTQRLGLLHCKTSTMRVEGQVLDHEREGNPFARCLSCLFQKSWLGLLDFLIVVVFSEVYYFCYKKLENNMTIINLPVIKISLM